MCEQNENETGLNQSSFSSEEQKFGCVTVLCMERAINSIMLVVFDLVQGHLVSEERTVDVL